MAMLYIGVMKNYISFGIVLRRLRFERGLSQEDLASRLELSSHAYISRLESGKKQPTVDTLFRISTALGVEAWEFVKAMQEVKK